jgi:anthranilate synthase component 1
MTQIINVPSLQTAREVIAKSRNSQFPPNLLPVTASIPADLLTPTLAYLKLAEKYVAGSGVDCDGACGVVSRRNVAE